MIAPRWEDAGHASAARPWVSRPGRRFERTLARAAPPTPQGRRSLLRRSRPPLHFPGGVPSGADAGPRRARAILPWASRGHGRPPAPTFVAADAPGQPQEKVAVVPRHALSHSQVPVGAWLRWSGRGARIPAAWRRTGPELSSRAKLEPGLPDGPPVTVDVGPEQAMVVSVGCPWVITVHILGVLSQPRASLAKTRHVAHLQGAQKPLQIAHIAHHVRGQGP